MFEFFGNLIEPIVIGLSLAVFLALPKVWVQTILNKRDIEKHDNKFNGLFERVDSMSSDVSFIRGKIDNG
jgi:hypothetical protein